MIGPLFCLSVMVLSATRERLVVISDGPVTTDVAQAFAAVANKTVLLKADMGVDKESAEQQQIISQAFAAAAAGKKLAFRLDERAAIGKYQEALSLFARASGAMTDLSPVAACLIDLGAAWMELHNDDNAVAAFRRAIILATSVRPEGRNYAPPVIARYERVEQQTALLPRSAVTVVGTPVGAELFIDGRGVGTLPMTIRNVIVGEHWLSATSNGYAPFSVPITLIAGHVDRLEVLLNPLGNESAVLLTNLAAAANDDTRISLWRRYASHHPADLYLAASHHADGYSGVLFDPRSARRVDLGFVPVIGDLAARIEDVLAGNDLAPRRLRATNVSPVVAWLPLGVGAFLEQRPLAGSLFLSSQVLLLATNLTAYWALRHDRLPDGSYRALTRDQALKWTVDIALPLLLLDVIGEAVEGELRR